MANDDFERSRRAFLKNAAGAWTAAGLVPPSALLALSGPAAAATSAVPLASMAKIQGSSAPAEVRWWLSAQQFLCVPGGGPLTPILRLETLGIEHWSPLPGDWRVRRREIGYYADEAGEPLDRWTNPLTGEAVTVPPLGGGAATTRLLRRAGADRRQSVAHHGDEIVVTEEQFSGTAPTPTGGAVALGIVSYHSSRKRVNDAAHPSVPADITAQAIAIGFPAWMRMAGHAGFLYTRLYGTKLSPGATVDPRKRAILNHLFPGAL